MLVAEAVLAFGREGELASHLHLEREQIPGPRLPGNDEIELHKPAYRASPPGGERRTPPRGRSVLLERLPAEGAFDLGDGDRQGRPVDRRLHRDTVSGRDVRRVDPDRHLIL